MTDIRKITEQEAANTAGGVEGYNYGNGWRTVMNLQGGYLAIRTAPSFNYENEIIHIGNSLKTDRDFNSQAARLLPGFLLCSETVMMSAGTDIQTLILSAVSSKMLLKRM